MHAHTNWIDARTHTHTGRSSKCDIVLSKRTHPSVSSNHLTIAYSYMQNAFEVLHLTPNIYSPACICSINTSMRNENIHSCMIHWEVSWLGSCLGDNKGNRHINFGHNGKRSNPAQRFLNATTWRCALRRRGSYWQKIYCRRYFGWRWPHRGSCSGLSTLSACYHFACLAIDTENEQKYK